MKRIKIFDTTLRDGEQSPGCSMNLTEKIEMARQLEKLGANQLKEKLVSITNTVEKAMTAKDKVAKTVTTITEKVTGFLGSVSKFFAGLFNK